MIAATWAVMVVEGLVSRDGVHAADGLRAYVVFDSLCGFRHVGGRRVPPALSK